VTPVHPTLSAMRTGLGLRPTPFLTAFEGYCSVMGGNVRALEWSHKFRAGRLEAGRFLHTARDGTPDRVVAPVGELLARVVPAGDDGSAARAAFGRLAREVGPVADGLAVGYADQEGPVPVSEIKVYYSSRHPSAVAPFAATAVPAGATPPEGTWRVMAAVSLRDSGQVSSRLYYLWRRQDVVAPTRAWLERWCTPQERHLLDEGGSPTICVSFKAGGRDMVYVSAPLGPALREMVCSLVRSPDGSTPSYLSSLRWVGFSKYSEGLPSREVNLYFPAGVG
jgi:hypothetical protein